MRTMIAAEIHAILFSNKPPERTFLRVRVFLFCAKLSLLVFFRQAISQKCRCEEVQSDRSLSTVLCSYGKAGNLKSEIYLS